VARVAGILGDLALPLSSAPGAIARAWWCPPRRSPGRAGP